MSTFTVINTLRFGPCVARVAWLIVMRAFRDRLEQASLEVQTPNGLGERLKSHPMDVDSDSEVPFRALIT